MKIITCWSTLIQLAKELGKAHQTGDEQRINEAKLKHDEYVQICLEADEMIIPENRGNL